MKILKILGRTSLIICVIYALATVFFTPSNDLPNWFVALNLICAVFFLFYAASAIKEGRNKRRGL